MTDPAARNRRLRKHYGALLKARARSVVSLIDCRSSGWQAHQMWRLSRSENKLRSPWLEVGKFPTLSVAVDRVLKLEDASPDFSLFLTTSVNPSLERSDGEIMRRFHYVGKKAAYLLEWSLK